MKRAEIIAEFTVERGHIRNPGKFEGCHVFAPHFHELVLDGGGDETIDINGTVYDWFKVSAEDRAEFPELTAETEYVVTWTEDSGFFHAVPSSAAMLKAARAESEESATE